MSEKKDERLFFEYKILIRETQTRENFDFLITRLSNLAEYARRAKAVNFPKEQKKERLK